MRYQSPGDSYSHICVWRWEIESTGEYVYIIYMYMKEPLANPHVMTYTGGKNELLMSLANSENNKVIKTNHMNL